MRGEDILNGVRSEMNRPSPEIPEVRKYPALRIIANVNRVVGAILILVGCLGLIGVLDSRDSTGFAGAIGVLWSVVFGLAGTAWLAGAELIYVLIDIEATTR